MFSKTFFIKYIGNKPKYLNCLIIFYSGCMKKVIKLLALNITTTEKGIKSKFIHYI